MYFQEEIEFAEVMHRLESNYDWGKLQCDLIAAGVLLHKHDILFQELIRFFALKAMLKDLDGNSVIAPPLIDDLWCYLLQFPKDYLDMCRAALSDTHYGYLTYPVFDRCNVDSYIRPLKIVETLENYRLYFREHAPVDIWAYFGSSYID